MTAEEYLNSKHYTLICKDFCDKLDEYARIKFEEKIEAWKKEEFKHEIISPDGSHVFINGDPWEPPIQIDFPKWSDT